MHFYHVAVESYQISSLVSSLVSSVAVGFLAFLLAFTFLFLFPHLLCYGERNPLWFFETLVLT